jgi:hypothetical protein
VNGGTIVKCAYEEMNICGESPDVQTVWRIVGQKHLEGYVCSVRGLVRSSDVHLNFLT